MAAHPTATYKEALLEVSKDPRLTPLRPLVFQDRIGEQLLDRAERYRREHPGTKLKTAILAISREDAETGTDLNSQVWRFMKANPAATYAEAEEAVLAADQIGNPTTKTVKSGPYPGGDDPAGSAAKLDADTQSTPLSIADVEAYAKRKGITYKAALLELDTARLKPGARAKTREG